MRVFTAILDLVFPPRQHEARVKGARRSDLYPLIAPHIVGGRYLSLLPYRAPLVTACIHEAKFHGNAHAQALLAEVLAHYLRTLQRQCAGHRLLLLPIPLSKERLRERGYNQVERIARRAIADITEVELATHILRRVRNTLPQTSLLGPARRRNLKGAFAAQDADPGHTYIVFDDVATTGATLEAAAGALRADGAQRIYLLSLAH